MKTINGVPQLATTIVEPLQFLEQHFLENRAMIESWFAAQWQLTRPPVYGSIDLRNAGFKLAPVDMNLFPAGFNNLNPAFLSTSSNAAKIIIEALVPGAKKIIIVPEAHTRNVHYWDNIEVLKTILHQAGFEIRLGALEVGVNAPHETIDVLVRKNDRLTLANFEPDIILLNNDLSAGIPDLLQHLKQPVLPPAELGWSQRFKSDHFQYYAQIVTEFAAELKMDPWLLTPLFRYCGEIDFMRQDGLDCLIKNAETLFAKIQSKYEEYHITHQPFLIVKADAGTYGMAVMTVRSIEELKALNRKQRTRMATTKGGQPVRRVIIQEGVYTFETWGKEQAVAEPVVYLWGSQVVGGFYRVHQERGVDENLNSPGMKFEPLPFMSICDEPCAGQGLDTCQNRFYVYGIVARLSMLAAAREIRG